MTGSEQRPDIEYAVRPASPLLAPVLRCFIHGYSHTAKPHRISIPPSEGMVLSFIRGAPMNISFDSVHHAVKTRLFVGGQLRRQTPVLESQGRFDLIGMQFSPCGFHQLFHDDAEQFTDTFVELIDFLGEEAVNIESEWRNIADTDTLFGAMEAYLVSRLPKALKTPTIDQAVSLIESQKGQIRVEELAKACHVSERQLHRKFLKVVGVGPKHFAKTVQLKNVLAELEQKDKTNLKTLAHEHGYFDQSHFVHDFQRFVGMNPLAFLQDDTPLLSAYLLQQAQRQPE